MLDPKQKRSYNRGINKLPLAKRVQILSMLCEGSSMRSISRVADVSINTVYKLLTEAGPVCARFHDATVRGVASQRIQSMRHGHFATPSRRMQRLRKVRRALTTFGLGRHLMPTRS
jgi:lambda repressor-like predicted transcriptional regulator